MDKGTIDYAKVNAKKMSEQDRYNYYHVLKNSEGKYYASRYYDRSSLLCYSKGKVYWTNK